MKKIFKTLTNTRDPDVIVAGVIGKRYRDYRRRWRRAEKLEVFQKYPIHIDFELSFGCTLKCPQCIIQVNHKELGPGHPYHMDNRRKVISFEKFAEIIDEGVRFGLCSITLNVNNEPLIIPDIARYIRYARQAGILDVIMLTNATLLTKDKSAELLEAGLTKIYFSLDAAREKTYKVVRRGGDLKETLENINYFLRLKKKRKQVLPITRVSFVKNKINAPELGEFIAYWKKRVDFISVQAFMNPAYGYSNYQALQEAFYLENEELKEPGLCTQSYQRLTVYNDGSVHPCCLWYGVLLSVGNIHQESIYSIWNSQKMRRMRRVINHADPGKTPEACKICRKVNFGRL